MNRYYAGIGARACPKEVCEIMTSVAGKLELEGWTLRSGGAEGADTAFSLGVEKLCECFLPWSTFATGLRMRRIFHKYIVVGEDDVEAEESINLFHPNGPKLKQGVRAMMRRNYRQIVGKDAPNSKFVICWTADGEASGGTGQALRIAANVGCEIINLRKEKDLERILKYLG